MMRRIVERRSLPGWRSSTGPAASEPLQRAQEPDPLLGPWPEGRKPGRHAPWKRHRGIGSANHDARCFVRPVWRLCPLSALLSPVPPDKELHARVPDDAAAVSDLTYVYYTCIFR